MIHGLFYPDGRTLNTIHLRAVACIVMPNTRHFPNLWLVSYTILSLLHDIYCPYTHIVYTCYNLDPAIISHIFHHSRFRHFLLP